MKKSDYLTACINLGLTKHLWWHTQVFGLLSLTDNFDDKAVAKEGELLRTTSGYMAFMGGQWQKLELADPQKVLYGYRDQILVSPLLCPNAKKEIQATIGSLLFNLLCVVTAFGLKFDFIEGRVNLGAFEQLIADRLEDTPDKRSATAIYPDEYVRFVDSLQFFKRLAQLSSYAATKKNIRSPDGIDEYRRQLLKKYEGRLTDPTVLVQYEKELQAFDSEYLKDDPSNGVFLAGKLKNTARKKLFLGIGQELGFEQSSKVSPVLQSLEQGWPTDPEGFAAVLNGQRAGSFSRGAETVNGGVAAKVLLRASNNFRIVDTDCKTALTLTRSVSSENAATFVGRYVRLGTQVKLVEKIEDLSDLMNKTVQVRTPMSCRLEGDNLCRVCAGERLYKYPTGLAVPLTEISARLLTAALKVMHVSTLSTQTANLADILS